MNKHLISVLVFLYLIFSSTFSLSYMLADYDNNWTNNTSEHRLENQTTGIWTTLAAGHAMQSISVTSGQGVRGNAAKIDVTSYGDDGLFKIYFAYDENRYATLDASKDSNRMILYSKIPYAGDGNEHTFHIGTYSKNPATANSTSNVGMHWYHYFEIRGNDTYWMKFYINKHPQHKVSSDDPPPNNPTMPEFDYFDGLTRMYFQMKYSPFESNWPGAYTVMVDEIEFYNEARIENEYSINGVVITYFGDGEFDIDWSSFSQYHIMTGTYEVKYSKTPINTDTDYNNAELLPGSPTNGWGSKNIGHHDNHYRANFTIQNIDEQSTYYFAIKDIGNNTSHQTKMVNYTLNHTENTQLQPPTNVNITN